MGGSEGSHSGGRGEVEDARAALDYLRGLPEVDPERVVLAGYSFGAAVALRAAGPGLCALVVVSLPTIAGPLAAPEFDGPSLFISGDCDEYSDPHDVSELAAAGGPGAEALIVPDADHFWSGAEDRLSDTVASSLERVSLHPRRPPAPCRRGQTNAAQTPRGC